MNNAFNISNLKNGYKRNYYYNKPNFYDKPQPITALTKSKSSLFANTKDNYDKDIIENNIENNTIYNNYHANNKLLVHNKENKNNSKTFQESTQYKSKSSDFISKNSSKYNSGRNSGHNSGYNSGHNTESQNVNTNSILPKFNGINIKYQELIASNVK